jgi:SAM-dependent methyltransferase
MNLKEHWENVYRTKRPSEVSWYQAEADVSARLIQEVAPDRSTPLLDVGSGTSVLVSQLVAAGYSNLTVVDISGPAIATAQAMLGPAAASVRWIEADILKAELPAGGYRVWHDRAVFHFLTDPADRATYVAQVRRAVAPGGHVLVATFAEDGPTRCSGLDVVRYSPASLHATFGAGFRLLTSEREEHRTPGGSIQTFTYCLCQRIETAMTQG